MTSPKLRKKPSENKDFGRETVLRAAATVFMNQSFADASIDDVAELLGATKGKVYHYFESKLDIYLNVHHVAITSMLADVEPISKLEIPVLERIRQMAHKHLLVVMTGFPYQKVSVQGFTPNSFDHVTTEQQRMIRKVVDLRDSYEDLYAFEIERGIAQGVINRGPPRLLTKPLLGALNWVTVWYDPGRNHSDARVQLIAATISNFVVNGLRGDASPLLPPFKPS